MTDTAIIPDLQAILHRAPAAPPLPFPPGAAGVAGQAEGPGLARGRVHEFCGPARQALAAMVAGALSGPVLWLRPGWQAERLYMPGLAGFLDPARLIRAEAARQADLLWAAEEGLRSGAVTLVVAELPEPPGLTPVRRLHLAAAEGGGVAMGLLLTEGEGGAAGVESRWHLAPVPSRAAAPSRPPATGCFATSGQGATCNRAHASGDPPVPVRALPPETGPAHAPASASSPVSRHDPAPGLAPPPALPPFAETDAVQGRGPEVRRWVLSCLRRRGGMAGTRWQLRLFRGRLTTAPARP